MIFEGCNVHVRNAGGNFTRLIESSFALARGEIAVGHRARKRELLVGLEQRVLADLVEVDLRNVVDEIRREPGFGLGERQFARPAVGLRDVRGCLNLVVNLGWGGTAAGTDYALSASGGIPCAKTCR